MKFLEVSAPGVDFGGGAHGEGAIFSDSNLQGASFRGSYLEGATFNGSDENLTLAGFSAARLSGASFKDVNLGGADFTAANLSGVTFEPRTLPDMTDLAEAEGLHTLRAPGKPVALNGVRKEFSNMGLPDRVRDLTLAIQRNTQARFLYSCQTGNSFGGRRFKQHPIAQRAGSCVIFGIRAVALDATCQFGRKPWRPLAIIASIGLLAALVLAFGIPLAQRSAIHIEFNTRCDTHRWIPLRSLISRVYPRRNRPAVYLRFAMALTLSAVFNLPFKQVDVGKWLRMLSPRDYEFQTRGWIRSFSGCVSLACFYLLTLWVLSLLGESLLG